MRSFVRALSPVRLGVIALVGALATASGASAQPQSKPAVPARQCFRAQDWRGSTAVSPTEMLIRVGARDIYRVNFAQDCPGMRFAGPLKIENVVMGNNQICSSVDLDLWIGPQGSSFTTPCIVDRFSKLTADEVAALPRKSLP